ncbi:MAG: hypothetical protein COT43_00485 [Candidatus Marinimicrobia bacterium CG08_land_8_20_14_0_20_45_22]|nr:MAG: hypothetical protein COT43_00485 [Candidatus Marinimicrobia bacterium CG08_land_8_20_14_0_20_45_22]
MIPHYKPSFDETDVAAAASVIRSGHLAQGEVVTALEHRFAELTNRRHAVAVSSGTTALTMSLLVMKIGVGDEVIIPSYTCSALWHAVRAIGATPVFCEIEKVSYNLDPEEIRKKISIKTKAVIFPHMFGQPGRIDEATNLGVPIIEDIAQGIGGKILNQPVGSFGDITISSFYATKPIGAGEGGIVLTDNLKLAEKIRSLREYDEQETLTPRFNAKMTDLTAAIALSQLDKFPLLTEKRKKIFRTYLTAFGKALVIPNITLTDIASNFYRCIIQTPNTDDAIRMAETYNIRLRKPVFKPLHLYSSHEKLEITESAWEHQVSIPIFPSMSDEEISLVISKMNPIFSAKL